MGGYVAMMKNKKHILAFVVVITMLITICLPAFGNTASSNEEEQLKKQAEKYVQEWVYNNYTEHYDISDYKVQITDFDKKGNTVTVGLLTTMGTTLKYKNVDALPYMQGMKSVLGVASIEQFMETPQKMQMKSLDQNAKQNLTKVQQQNIINVVTEQYEDAKECLNVATPLSADFVVKATVDNGKLTNVKMYDKIFDKLYPVEGIKSGKELKKEGASDLLNYTKSEESKVFVASNNSRASSYDRIAARDYVLRYTSNGTNSCHCGRMPNGVNYSKWNNAQYPYEARFCHSDCADFVSQGLAAGGIPVNSGWNRNQSSWTMVRPLCNYLVNKGYATTTNYANCVAGNIVNIGGHVIMVTLNDTVHHRFSAHTTDRLNRDFTNQSGYQYYKIIY